MSLACALHCLALPLLLLVMPVLQLGLNQAEPGAAGWAQWLLWSHQAEWLFCTAALLLAAVVLVRGFRVHRRPAALRRYGFGALVLLLTVGEWFDLGLAHGAAMALGGGLLAWAHLTNLRLLRQACC